MSIIRTAPKMKNAIPGSIVPYSTNINLATNNNATTSIVGISIHLLSKGFLSAINSNIPQENAMADSRPIGYTISVNPILSGINTNTARLKSAIAAVQ